VATEKPKWVAEGKALSILSFLQARFETIPMKLQNRLVVITDLTHLESLARQSAVCSSLKDFEQLLGK
jgi:hypothetical protein